MSSLKVDDALSTRKNPLQDSGGHGVSPSNVNFIDSTTSLTRVNDENEINNVKRKRGGGGSDIVLAEGSSKAARKTNDTGDVSMMEVEDTGVLGSAGGVSSTLGVNGDTIKTKRKRKPVRHLDVSIRKHSILDMMSRSSANASLLDWLATDKNALQEMSDAIRTLKARSKKTRTSSDGAEIIFSTNVKNKGKSRVTMVNSNAINSIDQWDDGYNTSDSDSENSFEDSDDSYITDSDSLESENFSKISL